MAWAGEGEGEGGRAVEGEGESVSEHGQAEAEGEASEGVENWRKVVPHLGARALSLSPLAPHPRSLSLQLGGCPD